MTAPRKAEGCAVQVSGTKQSIQGMKKGFSQPTLRTVSPYCKHFMQEAVFNYLLSRLLGPYKAIQRLSL